MEIGTIIGIAIIVILCCMLLGKYNGFIKAKNKIKQAESGIDVYLNQRFDLIPNLIECVKSYSKHEKTIFDEISKLRAEYMNNEKNIKGAEALNNKMNQLMAVAENYPDLKASEQYLELQKTLTKLESQLQAARRIYNSEVTDYNNKICIVPSNIIAMMFGFEEVELFEIEEIKKENIAVKFEE